ncbi:hypothetical protein [Ruminococcus flavefaciens]|uniref:hypothetical protein n=1 Tax=Ruminococcus flavefaciens TaxID=1265 RepID=UPI0002E5956C|nr:hypothetical protein [Ruminococcus flavefaciens]
MNPLNALKLKSLFERFIANHPKLPMFFKAAMGEVREGTIIEIKVISPENKTILSNLKICADDMSIVEELKEIR